MVRTVMEVPNDRQHAVRQLGSSMRQNLMVDVPAAWEGKASQLLPKSSPHTSVCFQHPTLINWPCGLMDKALVFGTKDCRFESCQGHFHIVRSHLAA